MKRVISMFIAIISAVMLLPVRSGAEEPEVQIVYVEVEKQVIADPPKMKIEPAWKYDWPDELIDELASIYWAETGANGPRTAQEKLMITQLVWNRSQYGSPFPSDLTAVCKQRGEFNHGRVSDRNREAARANLDKVRSQAEGRYQGIDPNMTMAAYMTREGGSGILTFQDDQWVPIYRVEG